MAVDLDALDAAVPEVVRQVCKVLAAAGFEAYTVGGAVRDALLRRPADDWDVTTSAHPPDVQRLFKRTIPTGLQHGTVTVLLRTDRGLPAEQVEVTTFRGEGAYSDARRPDSVVFGVPLREDLARRDFVINAMAYDPIGRHLADPFGGVDDLAARRLRAVGEPAARFLEDGLRVMRAVRFVASLEFALDPATEAAIPIALPSLAKVSAERVRIELVKLLAARSPAGALDIAHRQGIVGVILPELDAIDWPAAVTRAEAAAPDPCVRLGALVQGVDAAVVDAAMRRLTLSNTERERVVRLARLGPERPDATNEPAIRRVLAAATRAGGPDLIELWRADGHTTLASRASEILGRGDPLAIGDLAVKGADVMRILAIPPGRAVGQALEALLEKVIERPELNTGEELERLLRSG